MGGSTTNQKIFPIFIKHHFLHVGILPPIDGFKDAESAFRGLRDTVGEARRCFEPFRMGGFVGVVYILVNVYTSGGLPTPPGSQQGCQPGVFWVWLAGSQAWSLLHVEFPTVGTCSMPNEGVRAGNHCLYLPKASSTPWRRTTWQRRFRTLRLKRSRRRW